MTGQEAQNKLEEVIDAIGLAVTLRNIEAVCYGKADHLRSNWQDEHTAKVWDKAGNKIGSVSFKIEVK